MCTNKDQSIMQWVRVRVRIRVRDRVRVKVRVRVRVSVSCAFSEAFVGIAAVGIGSVGIGTCTPCQLSKCFQHDNLKI